ncbi:MAG: HEAT repeat domain-containing protein [Planctomycetota bacterium]|nr:HEAT repeat domain-containing protein [Planctomycetota bacterium]
MVAQSGSGKNADFDTLIKELNHRIWEVRRDACEELGLLADARAIPHVQRLLQDSVGAVRFAAAETLGKLGARDAIPDLVKLLENPHFGSYGPVIESLANLKAREAVPHFIRLLRDPDARVRGLAANALMVMTRQVIAFKAKGTDEERELGIQMWEQWWEKNKSGWKP